MADEGSAGVRSVNLALDILEAVGFADEELGVTQIATRLHIAKGSVHRHLYTLVERGYLAQNPDTSRYRIGIKSHLLGRMASAGIDLLAASEQAMKDLRQETGQTVVLSAAEPKAARVVSTLMGKSPIEIGVRPGSELQFHASAQGKVALAFSRRPLMAKLQKQSLTRFTDHTITALETLRREIERVRGQGWASAPEEAMLGVNAVAAPIFDETGDCIGALAVCGSIQFIRYHPDAAQIAAVRKAAAQASRNLGFKEAAKGRAVA